MKGQPEIRARIIHAINQRQTSLQPEAYRLFNGFYEGLPGLVVDRYGSALVIFQHGRPGDHHGLIQDLSRWALDRFPGLQAVLLKERQHPDEHLRNGIIIQGNSLPQDIMEFGAKYALNLQMNQDASFYLDTRLLRRWLIEHMAGKRLLNTFAYTGSLGVAAGVGGAQAVTQTDLNQNFLQKAEDSWQLNHLPGENHKLIPGDFFRVMGRLRAQKRLFDCVILDPPYFSDTSAGRVDLLQGTVSLINKVRPLVGHEGLLVVVNNALYLSGEDFMREISTLCQSPYLHFHTIIPVPQDILGTPETIVDTPPVDPSPFNHPTKMVILKVQRKDLRQ